MPSSSWRTPRRVISCAILLPFGVVIARAQEPTAPPAAVDPAVPETAPSGSRTKSRPWFVSFYTGTTWAQSSDLRLMQPRLGTDIQYRDVGYTARSFTGSPYYGLKVGYFLPKTPRVGFELEFNHAKMYARLGERKPVNGTWQGQPLDAVEPISDRVDKFQITNGINALSLNFVYRVPVGVSDRYPDGRLQPYVGGGPQYTALYAINNVAGLGVREKYHPNGWGYQLLGGARYLLNTRVGAFLEGKYQHGDAVALIADQGANEGGRAETDMRLAHLAAGVFYQF